MRLPDIDRQYEAFSITYSAEVQGVTVPREDMDALKPFETRAHQQIIRVGEAVWCKDLVTGDTQWFEEGYTVTWSRNKAGEGILLVAKGGQPPFQPDLWLYEPQAGPCLPFATGLSRVKWNQESAGKRQGTVNTFAVSGELNSDGYPQWLDVVPGPGYFHEYRFSDFRKVGGLDVPFRTALNTKARIWKKATFVTEDLRFLETSDRLPAYPWAETVKVSDNRSGSLLSVQAAALAKYNGGKAPENLSQLIASLDKIRPAVVRKMNELEGIAQARRDTSAALLPTAAIVILMPIFLLLFAYFRVIRQSSGK